MTTVLDSPVTTNSVGKLPYLDGQATDEISHLVGFFSIADATEKCNPDREQSLPSIEPRQALGSGHLKVGSPLDPAVLLFHGVASTDADSTEVGLRLFVDILDDRVVQRSLVSLQRQDVVSSAINNLLRDGGLRPHRVDRDDGSVNVDERQQFGNRGDFIGFLRRGHLRKRQSKLARPNTDGMQGAEISAAIVTSPQRLSVDGESRSFYARGLRGGGSQRRQPHRKAGLKGIRLQGGQNSSEDIFLGNAMWKIQEVQQYLGLHIGPLGDGRWSIGSGEHRHDRNNDNTIERMQQVHRRPRILQLFEMLQDLFHIHPHTTCHRSSSTSDPERKNDGIPNHARRRNPLYCQSYAECALALGCRYIPVGVVASIFQHASSRAKDPNLHSHVVVHNVGVDSHGKSRSIHSPPVFRAKMFLGAYYRAKLAAGLRAKLGLTVERAGRSFRIKGVPKTLVDIYSKRRKEILKHMAEHGESGAIAAAKANLETREKKDFMISRRELFEQWRQINNANHFGDNAAAKLLRHGPRKPSGDYAKAFREALAEIISRKNHFTEREFILEVLWTIPQYGLDPDPVFEKASEYLRSDPDVVPLGKVDGEERFTTKHVLEEEKRMWTALEQLNSQPGLQASDKTLQKQLKKRPTIRQEQADFVKHLTQSKSAVRIGLGLAGTGKTYALKTFVDTMRKQSYKILGVAPTGQAAEVLGREIGIECQTITKFLGDYRIPLSTVVLHHAKQFWRAARRRRTYAFHQPKPTKITRKNVVLVDEAGMIGTYTMRKLVEHVARCCGTLCLVGDPAQLPAIDSTSPLQALTRRYGASTLKEIRRQKQDWAKKAAYSFSQGKVAEALSLFAAKNRITIRDDMEASLRQACLDWTEEGLLTPHRAAILANTNEQTEFANQLCQEHRLKAGCITPAPSIPIVDEGDEAVYKAIAHVGDRVLFTRNSTARSGYDVRNGSLGTVIKILFFQSKIGVMLDNGRIVTVDTRAFPHIRLGYAITTHKSQGASIPKIYAVVGGSQLQNLPASYVQATRGVEDTWLYTTKDLIDPSLVNLEESPLVQQMARSPDLRLATELLGNAVIDSCRRKPKIHKMWRTEPAPTPAEPVRRQPEQNATPAAQKTVSVIPPTHVPESSHPQLQPLFSQPQAPAEQPQQQEQTALPTIPTIAAAITGYQRLRLPAGTNTVSNGSLLYASCVDGGSQTHRHRPPPANGMAMPFMANSVTARRFVPLPSTSMPLSTLTALGMLSLQGTGSQDRVQVICPPGEQWAITVDDSLGIISPQDDVAGAIDFYNKPAIVQQLEFLDHIEGELRQFMPNRCFLQSLFVCLRREICWQLPNVPNPAEVARDYLQRFCRMLFSDPTAAELLRWFEAVVQPGASLGFFQAMTQLLQRMQMPYQPSEGSLRNLAEALANGNGVQQRLDECVDSMSHQYNMVRASEEFHSIVAFLQQFATNAQHQTAGWKPSPSQRHNIVDILCHAAGVAPISNCNFPSVLFNPIQIDHQRFENSPTLEYVWQYTTAFCRGEEATSNTICRNFLDKLKQHQRL